MADVKQVNDTTFEAEVLKSALPVLVDFWAPWCGPCKMLGPIVEGLAGKYAGKLTVCKLNTDESPSTPGKYDIHGIPTLIIFKGGKEVERHVGLAPEAELAGKIDAHLALFGGKKTQTGEVQQEHPARSPDQDYATRCMVENCKEQDESRSWDSDTSFRRVLDPLNAGQNAKARDEAEALAQKFPDFAYVYVWWAKAFLDDRNYAEARRVLQDGLSRSKQKYPLLNLMGEVEWKSGSLSEAVYWWVQGLICQQTRKGFGEEVGAYLYLYHVADALGLSTLATRLRDRVDFIRPVGKIRLSPNAASSLTALAHASDTAQIRQALQMVEKKYFTSEPHAGSPKQDDEIRALLRIAQNRDLDDGEERVKALKRLAEVGDSTAIGPLMTLYSIEAEGLGMIKFFIRETLESIRARGR